MPLSPPQKVRFLRPTLVRAFGINVPRMMTLTYGFGVGLAALAGVLAAPIYSVNPIMGSNLIIVVFAVVVIGGMGSMFGPIAGAAVIITMQNYLSGFGEWVLVIPNVIFVITVLLFRRGIVGEIAALGNRLTRVSDVPSASTLPSAPAAAKAVPSTQST